VGEGLLRVEEFSDPVYSFLQESPAKLLVASGALLERGRRVFKSLRARDRLLAAELLRRVRSYCSVPITYLLAYVCKKYPSCVASSVAREGGRRLRWCSAEFAQGAQASLEDQRGLRRRTILPALAALDLCAVRAWGKLKAFILGVTL
jgi:hypothetical protein